MATQKRRKKRRKNKGLSQKAMLVGGVAALLLIIVLAANIQNKQNQDKMVSSNYDIEENAISKDVSDVDEVQKQDEKANDADANSEEVALESDTETDAPDETTQTAEENGEETLPATNPMNEDGMTWTTFDGITMGSVKGGTYGSIYTEEQIKALDGTKQGYGQGVNVDENNRPVGAIWLQDDYGKYGAVYIAEESNQIYMTLDEGYENGYTSVILDTLKEKNCSAVFFVTMDYVKTNPDLVKRMIDEGHVVGNHSVSHKSMPTLSVEDASYEISELHQYVLDNFGYEMYLFRPPMGEFSEQTLALAQSLGYRTMLWSYAYRDYDTDNQPEVSEAFQKVTAAKHGGAVYLLHAVSATNSSIMSDVIDDFRNSGYTVGAFPR
jgi:peptidoglycan-N-acetylmuramic acid deacetylase